MSKITLSNMSKDSGKSDFHDRNKIAFLNRIDKRLPQIPRVNLVSVNCWKTYVCLLNLLNMYAY